MSPVLAATTSGETTQLSLPLANPQYPTWLADGQHVVVWGRGAGGLSGFHLVDTTTGDVGALPDQ